jgi:serine O-acetyltransferase
MNFHEYKYLVSSDLYRVDADMRTKTLIMSVLLGNETYQYNFWMRTCAYTRSHGLFKFIVYPFAKIMLNHYEYKFGISIPYTTDIGCGFYIGHFGTIVVNGRCKIGNNFNISHGVTLGVSNRGDKKGYPEIGNDVYLGPGAKIIGAIKIGNNVAVGANCVVTKDVPDNAVVVGVPGKIISYLGSQGYVENTDYYTYLQKPAS